MVHKLMKENIRNRQPTGNDTTEKNIQMTRKYGISVSKRRHYFVYSQSLTIKPDRAAALIASNFLISKYFDYIPVRCGAGAYLTRKLAIPLRCIGGFADSSTCSPIAQAQRLEHSETAQYYRVKSRSNLILKRDALQQPRQLGCTAKVQQVTGTVSQNLHI